MLQWFVVSFMYNGGCAHVDVEVKWRGEVVYGGNRCSELVELSASLLLPGRAKHVARAFLSYVIPKSTMNLPRGASNSPTLHSFPYILRYGDFCAFCIVFTTQCAVFSPGAADSVLEIGTASQKNNFSDIGTSPARFKGWSGWSSTCENDQVHFRVVCGDNRK
jgi:hypothetical protein